MAEIAITSIKDSKIEVANSKDGNTYEKLIVIDEENNRYSGFKNKIIDVNKNDEVIIYYQPVKTINGVLNNILNIEKVDTSGTKTAKNEASNMKQQAKETKSDFIVIKGKSYYAHIREPNTKGEFPTNKYQMELTVSNKLKNELESLGVEVKNKNDEKGNFVRLRSGFQPKVLDDNGDTVVDIPLIGNGSDVEVVAKLYPNKAKQGGKLCLGLTSVKLINLIEFKKEARRLVDE